MSTTSQVVKIDISGEQRQRLLEFYNQGERLTITGLGFAYPGMTFDGIIAKDDDFWEGCHDFIQWLFPTTQPSAFNPYAPILDKNTARWISKRNLIRAFERFMSFLGVKVPSTPDALGNIRYARVREWYQSGDHNLLRITRVLTCLMLCGMYNEARELEYFLHKCRMYSHGNGWEPVSDETWKFWNSALMYNGMYQSEFDDDAR